MIKLKVLRLTSYCYPEQMASSHLHNDINGAFEKAGIVCEIYTPTPTRGIDKETRRKYKKIKYQELNNGYIQIHRFSMFGEPKNTLFRAFRYTLCIIINFFNGLKAKDIDVYYASSTPPINGLIMSLLKRFKKFKIVYNLQDVFPDSLVNTSIDELPQIFNVLIGNMTLIGPRASGAGALGTYQEDEIAKMDVKPGITGFTQAYYRNGLTVREKRLKDAWYAYNVSLWLDIKIFFKTIVTVLKRENVYTNENVVEVTLSDEKEEIMK